MCIFLIDTEPEDVLILSNVKQLFFFIPLLSVVPFFPAVLGNYYLFSLDNYENWNSVFPAVINV